ncbi:low molecular weight protein-tyrosine-phosphatase [Aeromicrobium sp. YIM 150415]|uniref:low molecular weight protein-tyrosine-phosphatase n=1 Tax=Aeromicrobium sp. YIM 150415 TaxID=2803912 RepID=UPI0027DACE4B|nr:low molecular weight protein-tyrosine-phosphatase [Aeromicrobium sp. YIM 150415]
MTYRIAVVCLGNICRSPMAHVVLEKKLEEAGVDDVEIVSSGTGGWHTGDPMDPRAADRLTQAGYDASRHVARKFTTDWYAENDLLLAMDESNYADMAELAPTVADTERLRMFRSFDPQATEQDIEVPDPWFGGEEGFVEVLAMIERTSDALVAEIPALIASRQS